VDWKRLLAYISGSVDQELLLRNEYLAAENRILRNQIKGRLRLADGERKTLAELGKRLGKKALEEVANIVKPETILKWHRALIARKFDGSKNRVSQGRPKIEAELEALIIRLAKENRSWGYDRIIGALRKHHDLRAGQQHDLDTARRTYGHRIRRHRDRGIHLRHQRQHAHEDRSPGHGAGEDHLVSLHVRDQSVRVSGHPLQGQE